MTIRNYATAEGVNFFYSATCGWVAGSTTRNTNSETTAEVVKKSLLAMGEQVTQKAEGYWVLDGVLIKNPSDELGEEFEDICTFVCTKAATTQFVSVFSEAEVDAMMTAEVEAVNAKAVKRRSRVGCASARTFDSCRFKRHIIRSMGRAGWLY